ncbi:MAG TPA: response regulator [Acetivibrio sp.]|nr:response regulator [Clostridium sp.]HPT90568.1 response regulator [Acetivibrio sp.]HQA56791.1 response regulator [Acetivibrio sp.]
MFSVMIVDDDPKILEWLKSEIDWGNLEFNLMCSAKDGIDALHKLNQNDIDLVITDINMPKMDGIELYNSIKEYNLSPFVVYLSDPEDLPHVKQGLLLGAFGYVTKPIDKENLIDVLESVHEKLMEKKLEKENDKKIKERFEMSLSFSREKILNDLLRGKEFPHESLNYIINEYGINLYKETVQVGIIEVGNFDASTKELIKTGKFEELLNKVRSIIADILLQFEGLSCNMVEMDIGVISVILQPVSKVEVNEFEEITADFFEKVLKEIQRNANVRVTIGIGEACSKLRDISQSYMGAKAALRHKYILGGNRVIHIRQSDINEKQYLLYPAEREKLLVEYIMSGDDSAVKLAENVFDDIAVGTENNLKRIAFAANQLMFNISHYIDMKYDFVNKLYDFRKFNNVDFLEFGSKEEIKSFFILFVNSLMNVVREYLPVQNNTLIKDACEYVLNNIDQEITLARMADHLNISKNYFCSLFKQETGINFLEYVTKVKMEWAKLLLKEGTYKTYKVSEMLGYREASYFSRLFRKYTGFSPAEYKKQMQESQDN